MAYRLNYPSTHRVGDTLDDLVAWVDQNAKWSLGQAIRMTEGKVYLSSVEVDTEEDAVYCCLRFGLVRFD